MILEPPFLSTKRDFENWIVNNFCGSEFEIKWYWSTFHSPGLKALNYFSNKNISFSEVSEICDELSCPTPPKKLLKSFKKLGLLDSEDRIAALNIGEKIKMTSQLINGEFPVKSAFLPSVEDLNTVVTNLGIPLIPNIHSIDALKTVSHWLNSSEKLFCKFQNLSPWKKLLFLENTFGTQNSHSNLQFSIYQPDA